MSTRETLYLEVQWRDQGILAALTPIVRSKS